MELTEEILQQAHSAKDYLNWTKTLISDFRSEENGIEQIRLRKGLAKQLMEEMLPIGRFAMNHFEASSDVIIELRLGNQHYDAIVKDKRTPKGSIEYIEVTGTNIVGASNGYEDYLFKHHLHHQGLSGTGKISAAGSKFKGLKTELQREMVSQAAVLEHEKQTIQEAIDRKSGIDYPAHTALVISFDDSFAFDRTDNIDNIMSVLEASRSKLAHFQMVSIVGYLKGLYLEFHPK